MEPSSYCSKLRQLQLTVSQTVRVKARSEQHQLAHVRVRKNEMRQLEKDNSQNECFTFLFSTASAREAVQLRSYETIELKVAGKWLSFYIVACHAFTEGLRVSSIIHRAVVCARNTNAL